MDAATAKEGFMEAYGRLNGIERDLAFAEISGNTTQLKNLENEKIEINEKINKILAEIGLTIEDLSPKFKCTKCNDTGYVGTHRCDCFDK